MTGIKVKLDELTLEQVAGICDHTFLKDSRAYESAAKPWEKAEELRLKALKGFLSDVVLMETKPYAVCVRAEDVSLARRWLDNNNNELVGADKVIVASAVGFSDIANCSTQQKANEAGLALRFGAREIDFVVNYNRLKARDYGFVEKEIGEMVHVCKEGKAVSKMILEVSELTNYDIAEACRIADKMGVDFVKTSTGFSKSGATVEALQVMRQNFPRGIKISGGVRTLDDAKKYLRAAHGVIEGTGAEVELDPLKVRIGESSLLKATQGSY